MDNHNSNQPRDITGQEVFVGGGSVVAIVMYMWYEQNPERVQELWFEWYTTIYMSGVGLAVLLALGVIFFINKKTKKLKSRADRLDPMSRRRYK